MRTTNDFKLPDNVSLDDLSEEQRVVAELIGLDNYRKLVENYPGCTIYIPKLDDLRADGRNAQIRSEFTGYNYRELSLKFGLSERHVREILAPIVKQVRARPMDGQVSLFENN